MIELKKNFEQKGREMKFSQKYKNSEVVIYEITHPDYCNEGQYVSWWEVFRYKTGKMNPMAVNYDPNEVKEIYPSDNDFGVWAWSCSTFGSIRKVLRRDFNFDDETISKILENL